MLTNQGDWRFALEGDKEDRPSWRNIEDDIEYLITENDVGRLSVYEGDTDDPIMLQCTMPLSDLIILVAQYHALNKIKSSVEEDGIIHPSWYNWHPRGIECWDVIEAFNFNLGTAIKYIWRNGRKNEDAIKDLQKAIQNIQREIKRITDYGQ